MPSVFNPPIDYGFPITEGVNWLSTTAHYWYRSDNYRIRHFLDYRTISVQGGKVIGHTSGLEIYHCAWSSS